VGAVDRPVVQARVTAYGNPDDPPQDIALLEIEPRDGFAILPTEFAAPYRHAGKRFSALGFPRGIPRGRVASGVLNAADALGLVQMDGLGNAEVVGGFSGSPVWSTDLAAFVGIVTSEDHSNGLAWCIPAGLIAAFHNDIHVKFRIPEPDRPRIYDYETDDPNPVLFGTASNDGRRRLSATVKARKSYYHVELIYECIEGSPPPRGKYVTFVTYPDFKKEYEDAYELFSELDARGRATTVIYPTDSFTVAAIGDAGDTALTLNLAQYMRE
jgi:hypothetical protein